MAFLAAAVANVARRRRLVWDCSLLGEERAVVDALTVVLSVLQCTHSEDQLNLRSDISRVSGPGSLVLVEHGL